jgi:MoaA/NifB/PqqE/SkfB family radical SAM enzyme
MALEIFREPHHYNKTELPYYLWRRLRWTFGDHSPIFGYLKITERCNLDCYYCPWHAPANKFDEELPTSEWKQIISQLIKRGVRLMVFEGGEPTLRKDLPDLLSHAHSQGAASILATNGIVDFWKFKPNAFTVSIDGPELIHDKARGKGAFRKTIANLKRRNSERPVIGLTVVTEDNAPFIEDMMEEINGLVDGFGFTFVYPYASKGITPLPIDVFSRVNEDLEHLRNKYRIINPPLKQKSGSESCRYDVTVAVNHQGKISASCFVEHIEKPNCASCQLACYNLFSSLHEFNLKTWFMIYRLIVRTI